MRTISKNKGRVFLLLALILAVSTISLVSAETVTTQVAADKINEVLCRIAQLIFMVVGAIAALVVIMAGLKWTTSADDPGARNAAKTTIISVFVGLIIVMIAVYIVSIVIGGFFSGLGASVNFVDWVSKPCPTASSATPSGGGDTNTCTCTGGLTAGCFASLNACIAQFDYACTAGTGTCPTGQVCACHG